MNSVRQNRLASVIQSELSNQIRFLHDPRISPITITKVEVAHDGSHANVFFTLFGSADELSLKDTLEGLNSSKGPLRRHLAQALTIRHVPTLTFKADKGFENVVTVNELLQKISSEKDSVDTSKKPKKE